MSDVSQGPGWWQASDGKWYPPAPTPGAPAVTTTEQAPRRHRGKVVALILVLGAVIGVAVAAATGGSSAKTDPADVAAARACQTFVLFLGGKADGAAVVATAGPLLSGAADGSPGPWASLGANLIQAGADVNSGDTAKITADGNAIGADCGSIPTAAKRKGGYIR